MGIKFVGKRFTREEFEKHLKSVVLTTFQPEFVTLHHTALPSLAMRPDGFSDQHLQNLLSFYTGLGWSGAPHIFVDDQGDGIILFQRLDTKGVHARSFNSIAWGIEMLGDYDKEAFDSGRGAKVRDNAMHCLALMNKRLKVGAESIRFHRDDPKTNKTCPGLLVSKADVISRVAALMKEPVIEDISKNERQEWTVFLRNGVEVKPVHTKDGRPIARIRDLVNQLSPGGKFKANGTLTQVTWTDKKGKATHISIAQIDEAGFSWAFVRDISEALKLGLKVKANRVEIQT
jgi:N-acetylmuramoyl-L-alanine amidase